MAFHDAKLLSAIAMIDNDKEDMIKNFEAIVAYLVTFGVINNRKSSVGKGAWCLHPIRLATIIQNLYLGR